ncbi:M24 family metallopeptidase [Mesorhizobium sp. B4-1-4]|uniref:M24 family metallopeptidase n=1 Tax=Mesorhizobium sp. B4-1-4 TaxID=2589888 RepID=UPI001D00DAC3|nr:Xaa-Pro peptidase family protein [Mesorhizobium sp. B4-1-4]UCI31899.1 Xaa-Pro peptidase family protein [Mesorhizobium sp. B4-1-4]
MTTAVTRSRLAINTRQSVRTPQQWCSMMSSRSFEHSEFQARVTRAQALMAKDRLDGLLVTSVDNYRYFAGIESNFGESLTRPWFLLIPASGEPLAIIPAIAEALIRDTWVSSVRSWPSPRPEDEGTTIVAEAIRALPRRYGRVAAEFGHETRLGIPVNQLNDISQKVSGVELVDGARLIWTLRMIKSDAEVGKIQQAIDIAGAVFTAVTDFVSIGDSERIIQRKFRVRLLEEGADQLPITICRSGRGGPDGITGAVRDRQLTEGDLLFIDTGTVFDSYFCDYDRNYRVGRVSDALLAAHERVWEANEVGLRAAVPGATAGSIFEQMAKALSSDDRELNSNGRMGHGLGLRVTEPPSVRLGDDTVLAPGMVLCIEPALEYEPGKIVLHEETVLITADGAKLLTVRAPRELPTIR